MHTRNLGKPIKLVISNSLFSGSIDWNTGEYQPFNICMGVGGILGSAWCADDYAINQLKLKTHIQNLVQKVLYCKKLAKQLFLTLYVLVVLRLGARKHYQNMIAKLNPKILL